MRTLKIISLPVTVIMVVTGFSLHGSSGDTTKLFASGGSDKNHCRCEFYQRKAEEEYAVLLKPLADVAIAAQKGTTVRKLKLRWSVIPTHRKKRRFKKKNGVKGINACASW